MAHNVKVNKHAECFFLSIRLHCPRSGQFVSLYLLREKKVTVIFRMDRLFKLSSNFYLDKKEEIYHYSSKEHPKISKIAKFGCEML
jgi:hypothetical protein